jgi:hypothetical protein
VAEVDPEHHQHAEGVRYPGYQAWVGGHDGCVGGEQVLAERCDRFLGGRLSGGFLGQALAVFCRSVSDCLLHL